MYSLYFDRYFETSTIFISDLKSQILQRVVKCQVAIQPRYPFIYRGIDQHIHYIFNIVLFKSVTKLSVGKKNDLEGQITYQKVTNTIFRNE